MRVRYTETADRQHDQLLANTAADDPASASSVAAAIKATITRLRSFPRLGAETDVTGVRLIVARPYAYLIF